MQGKPPCSALPPGFRFHPTDEELIMCYLRNQVTSRTCPASIIPEVDIYKFDPWQLPEKAEFGENEWYFFTPRDRKYPNGIRPNRATMSGYWKATGTDKAIYSGSKYVGVKKALVFYKGRPPKGTKTDWIMHEYRFIEPRKQTNKLKESMRLDDWVLCRIYQKRHTTRHMEAEKMENTDTHLDMDVNASAVNDASEQQQMLKLPKTYSFTQLLEMDYVGPMLHLLNGSNTYDRNLNFHTIMGSSGTDHVAMPQQYIDSGKFQVNQNQQSVLHVNPMLYEFQ